MRYSAKTSKPSLTARCKAVLLKLSVVVIRSDFPFFPTVKMNSFIFMVSELPFKYRLGSRVEGRACIWGCSLYRTKKDRTLN
jgi:hypothetical protein